jgi:TP901 family phage tail tape measure protein
MASNPKAEVQITAESRTLAAKLREARAQFGKFGASLKKEVFGKVLFDGPKASAHMFGQLGAQAAGRGFGFLEDQAKGVLDFNTALLNFQLAARKTPEEAHAIGQAARDIATETGLASEVVLAGEKAFVDLAGAENGSIASMRTLARTARASNTEIGAMSTVMYALQNALHVKPEEMEDTLSGLINQSKDGTIHFANMAEEIIGMAPKFARFGVTGRQGAIDLGAMFQVVRSGSKSAEETTTKLDGIFRGLIRNAAKFKKGGVTVFNVDKDGVKTLKPFQEIWAQLEKSKLMKDPSKLIKTFGRGDGEAGIRLLIEMKKKYEELVEAGRVNGTVQQDLATINESAGGRTAAAMERVKNAVAEAFTPERINGFVTAVEALADKVGPVADGIGKIGSVLGGLYGVGQKVSGFFLGSNENANPWKEQEGKDVRWIQKETHDGGMDNSQEWLDRLGAAGVDKGRLAAFRSHRENKASYDAAVEDITGAQVDDRSSPASIERAVLAKFAEPSMPGGLGKNAAGQKYLTAAHVSDAQAQEIYAKAFVAALKNTAFPELVKAIREGFAGAKTEVKADGKAIVDVHRGSAAHARRPGG